MAERSGANPGAWRRHESRAKILAARNPDGTISCPWNSARPLGSFPKINEPKPDVINNDEQPNKKQEPDIIYEAQAAD